MYVSYKERPNGMIDRAVSKKEVDALKLVCLKKAPKKGHPPINKDGTPRKKIKGTSFKNTKYRVEKLVPVNEEDVKGLQIVHILLNGKKIKASEYLKSIGMTRAYWLTIKKGYKVVQIQENKIEMIYEHRHSGRIVNLTNYKGELVLENVLINVAAKKLNVSATYLRHIMKDGSCEFKGHKIEVQK